MKIKSVKVKQAVPTLNFVEWLDMKKGLSLFEFYELNDLRQQFLEVEYRNFYLQLNYAHRKGLI